MNKPIKVVIVDDEPDAVKSIELIISEFCKDIEVVATANMIDKAWDLIKATEPDLVFLDIDMPRGTGFDLLERFPFRRFGVVFITAYSKYVGKAERYGAFAYLHKPIDIDLFNQTVERFRQHLDGGQSQVFKLM